MPVKIDILVVTSPFGMRTYNGQKIFHQGVDLRSVNRQTGAMLDIIAPETCEVLRNGVDGFGNYFLVCKPLESPFKEIKFIHMDETCLGFTKGAMLQKGAKLGFTRVGGNSAAHHLHFEVWTDEAVNPCNYFDFMGIKWKNV